MRLKIETNKGWSSIQ